MVPGPLNPGANESCNSVATGRCPEVHLSIVKCLHGKDTGVGPVGQALCTGF